MKQSIENINNSLNTIKETFSNFIVREKEIRKLDEIVYWEFTLKDIISDTEFLLKILSYLVKSNNLFFNISTQGDRTNIYNTLNNLNSYFSLSNFNYIVSHLDTLKTYIRNYNPIVLSKKDFLSDVWNDILEIQGNSKVSSSLLDKINSDIKLKEEIIEKLEKLEDDYNDLDSKLEIISEKKEEIIKMTTDAEANKKIIDNFSSNIEKREEDIVKLKNKTSEYEEKLKVFKNENEENLKIADNLIKSAKKALKYKTAEWISASIQTQYEEAKKETTTWWIFLAILFILITLWLWIWLLSGKDLWIEIVIWRLALLPITIWGAIFSANQYVRQKNIIEDYAYKLVLVKSIIWFSEELLKVKENTNYWYQRYIAKTLDELLQDPLRDKSNKKNETIISSKSLKEWLDFIKQAKDVTK